MVFKISYHIMPWEIDYALLSFTQLKKSSFYLPDDVTIKIDAALNLSDYLIDWGNTKMPKQFFIDKFNDLLVLLDRYEVNPIIYEGKENYGFFDVQRAAYEPEVDYYIGLCPDIYFSEHLLSLVVESVKVIPNKHFVLIPEIYKMWDWTWDEITNKQYLDVPYDQWSKGDIFEIRHNLKTSSEVVTLQPVNKPKFAWWFDVYSKDFYEKIAPVPEEWIGYGGWDFYAMNIAEYLTHKNIDFQQYIMRGQTAFEYPIGPLREKGYINYHKKYFSIKKNAVDQRKIFEANLPHYLQKAIKNLEQNNYYE